MSKGIEVAEAIRETYARWLAELAQGDDHTEGEVAVMQKIVELIGRLRGLKAAREPVPTAEELRKELDL